MLTLKNVLAYTIKDEKTGCRIWQGGTHKGYPVRVVKGKPVRLNRWICQQTHGGEFETARHTCDTPRCLEPTHIIPGTNQDNVDDRQERGRQAKGTQIYRAKLTEETVRAIRLREAEKPAWGGRMAFLREVASEFGITPTHVHKIWRRADWGWLK